MCVNVAIVEQYVSLTVIAGFVVNRANTEVKQVFACSNVAFVNNQLLCEGHIINYNAS